MNKELLVTASEMQEIDRVTIQEIGIASKVLMERAAAGVLEEIRRRLEPLTGRERVFIAVGTGNNGGDGLALARMLLAYGMDVDVLLLSGSRYSEEYLSQKEILTKISAYGEKGDKTPYSYGTLTFLSDTEEPIWMGNRYEVVCDAIFGTGLTREVGGTYADVIDSMNYMSGLKVAIDIPSGIDATTGKRLGMAFRADLTVTMGYRKTGQLFLDGTEACGELVVKEIGFPAPVAAAISRVAETYPLPLGEALMPSRNPQGNKGTFGKITVVAGSEQVYGAVYLCAMAAYRSGCGLVEIITHENNRHALQQGIPEALLHCYRTTQEAVAYIEKARDWADLVVIGPGIGTDVHGEAMVRTVASMSLPVVLDADALTILGRTGMEFKNPVQIYTPHRKEMERISGVTVEELAICPWEKAKDYVMHHSGSAETGETQERVLILKDARTVVAGNKADRVYINLTGNDGMAVGGSGDVLAGLVASMYVQTRNSGDAYEAACRAVAIHGALGDVSAAKKSKVSMLPTDMLEELARLIR